MHRIEYVSSLVLLSLLLAPACRKTPESTEPETPLSPAVAPLAIRTFPVRNALVGEAFQYAPELTKPGAASWQLLTAPTEAQVQDGRIHWTPQTAGSVDFTVRGELAGETVEQHFTVEVAGKTEQASVSVDRC